MAYKVFYSWQSDLPNPTNRGFIQTCIEKAIQHISNSEQITNPIILDRDTTGITGAPDIAQTIFSKIEQSVVFICDVSIIHDESVKDRRCPNPNVLLELGYALKTLGPNKVILLMNTYFGDPTLLPFDLKQKRVLTYNLDPNATDKSEQKQYLENILIEPIKSIIHEAEQSESTQEVSLVDSLLSDIENQKPTKVRTIHKYMEWLGSELRNYNHIGKEGELDDNLVDSINATTDIVKGFDNISSIISTLNDEESAQILFKDFEHILTTYFVDAGFNGSYRNIDFDFFKFIGNELFVIFIGHLLKDNRFNLIHDLLNEKIYIPNSPRSERLHTYTSLVEYVSTLDEIRKKRKTENNQQRVSHHADILKERHSTLPLSENLSWDEFREADLLLYFYAYTHQDEHEHLWWPRTYIYIGDFTPRFLINATSYRGAESLAKFLDIPDVTLLPDVVKSAMEEFTKMNSGSYFPPHIAFDTKTIAVPKK